MSTVVKTRTPEGVRRFRLEDVRPYWLYDEFNILPTNVHTEFVYFQNPDKTIFETNMRQFSSLPIGWIFDATRIRVVPIPSITVADAELLFGRSVVSYLKEGDIEIFTIPALMLNSGCGLLGATTVTATDIVSLGDPSHAAVMKLPFPITIRGGKTFQFKLKFPVAPTPAAATRIKMVLDGILRRDVVGA